MRFAACVRSGYCCKVATCYVGLEHGAEPKGCKFLMGDKPGEYSCAIADQIPTIGAGCPSSLNTDRRIAKGDDNAGEA